MKKDSNNVDQLHSPWWNVSLVNRFKSTFDPQKRLSQDGKESRSPEQEVLSALILKKIGSR